MPNRIDPLQTIDTQVRSLAGVSTLINVAGLHAQSHQLPLGIPFQTVPTVGKAERGEVSTYGPILNLSQVYLSLSGVVDGQQKKYVFRLDPIIAVSGKNIITRRYVAKMRVQREGEATLRNGSVKESWSQDDYDITISGVLIGDNAEELNEQVQDLQSILVCGESLAVVNDLLNDGYGITHLVVDSFQFPHTKGLRNQAYTIKCYSDSSINILEEVQ